MEVVHPLDSDSVTLRPCPPWCTEGRHFGDDEVIYADDGYHHYGTEIEVPTSDTFLGMTGAPETIVRMVLTSWTHPLDAEPGPALIELNLGTVAGRTDMRAEVTPAEARAVARALLDLADTAERDGPAASPSNKQEGGPAVARRVSDDELLAGALHARIERWLELEGVFTIIGFGDVELAGELDWEPDAGPVYLRRLDDGQVWRADIAVTARASKTGEAGTRVW